MRTKSKHWIGHQTAEPTAQKIVDDDFPRYAMDEAR